MKTKEGYVRPELVHNFIKVVSLVKYGKSKYHICEYKCICGNIFERHHSNTLRSIASGNNNMCYKCSQKYARDKKRKVPKIQKTIKSVWRSMISRCSNPKNKSYRFYGSNGISVCKEWTGDEGFCNFMQWCLDRGYKSGLSIDRIDVYGNYSPENCRLSDINIQSWNKRNTRYLQYEGYFYPAALIAKGIGVKVGGMCATIKRSNNTLMSYLIERNLTDKFFVSINSNEAIMLRRKHLL